MTNEWECNPLDGEDLVRITRKIIDDSPMKSHDAVVCVEGSLTTCIVASLCLALNCSGSVIRKPKDHGTQKRIENPQPEGTGYWLIVEDAWAMKQAHEGSKALEDAGYALYGVIMVNTGIDEDEEVGKKALEVFEREKNEMIEENRRPYDEGEVNMPKKVLRERKTIPASEVGVSLTVSDEALKKAAKEERRIHGRSNPLAWG